MIAPNFERRWQHPEPEDGPSQSPAKLPSIHQEILADMDNRVWLETPATATETFEPASERLPEFTEAAVEDRRRQDQLRRTELLDELRQLAEPPVPPIEHDEDGGRDPDRPNGDGRSARSSSLRPSGLRRCPVCDGTGRRWLLLTCRNCGGLGAVVPRH